VPKPDFSFLHPLLREDFTVEFRKFKEGLKGKKGYGTPPDS